MIDRRVRVPPDKVEIINKLRYSEDNKNGIFKQYSDILSFCATLGYKYDRFNPFDEGSSSVDPIRQDVFVRSRQDILFYLLAYARTGDPECLSNSEQAEKTRIEIFEAYANGGLEILRERLHGREDPLDFILLMISRERNGSIH